MKGLWKIQCDSCGRMLPDRGEKCIYCGADKAAARAAYEQRLASDRQGLHGWASVVFALASGFAVFVACGMIGIVVNWPDAGIILAPFVSGLYMLGVLLVTNAWLQEWGAPAWRKCSALCRPVLGKCLAAARVALIEAKQFVSRCRRQL